MGQSSDVVIIGGGIIGLTTAYYLRREKLEVTVVERGPVGREASWAAAGYLSFQGSSNLPGPRLDLTRASRLLYDSWIEELAEYSAIDTGFLQCGLLEVCLNDAEAQEARARAAWQQAAGYRAEWLDATAARQRQPSLAADLPVHGALWCPDVAQVRPPRLLQALTEALVQMGVHIREYAPVVGLKHRNEHITGVLLAGGEHIAAPHVVNAAGSWAAYVAPEMSHLPVKPIKGTVVLLEVPRSPTRELLVTSQGSLYPRADNKVLVGATLEEDGYDRRVKLAAIDELVHRAVTLVPMLQTASFVTAWTGLRPASHDQLPYLGTLPGFHGAYLATGHHRSGILLAPITGVLLKEIILQQPTTLPVAPYHISRLQKP